VKFIDYGLSPTMNEMVDWQREKIEELKAEVAKLQKELEAAKEKK
jgi:hypothetical protein